MEFNFKKYIACLILALVCLSAVIPLAYSQNVSAKELTNNQIEIDKLPESDIVVDESQPLAPIFKNAYTAFNYAKDRLNNSDGYELVISTTYGSSVSGVNVEIYMYTEAKRRFNEKLETIISLNDLPFTNDVYQINHLEDDIVCYNATLIVDKKNIQTIVDAKPDWTNSYIRIMTHEDYIKNKHSVGFDVLPLEINNNTAKINYFTSNSSYYNLSFRVDVNSLSQAYIDSIKTIGGTDISYSSVNFDCVIHKKTGNFISATKTETGRLSIFGFTLDVVAVTKYNFKSVGVASNFLVPSQVVPTTEELENFKNSLK